MLRFQMVLVLLLGAITGLGCSGDEPPPAIDYATIGPLVGDAGKGAFRFGAASAATQIEDMNPTTDWYVFTSPAEQGGLGKGSAPVGDAARGYSRALEDVQLAADLNLDAYRFSVEWARIEPLRDVIDEAALQHYSDQLDALIALGIRPMITIHHFSNPVWVDDPAATVCGELSDDNLCGFGHPVGGPLVVEELREHAALLAARFGDRVDEWATVNEPVNYLLAAYGLGLFPPGKSFLFRLLDDFIPVVRDYLAGHAAMYAAIKANDSVDADRDGVAASVGMTLSVIEWTAARFNQPSDDPVDLAARDRVTYVYHHFVPEALRTGMFDSDLDGVGDEPQPDWAGTLDWLGVQYYFRTGVTGNNGLIPVLELTPCFGGFDFGSCVPAVDETSCVPAMRYEYYAPGLYRVLRDFGTRWPDLPLVVSESGIATQVGARRAENVVRALEHIERARDEGVDVRGYYHWSLTDNFEWAEGFAPRFGLYSVDDATYDRTPTTGADVLGAIAGERRLSAEQRSSYGGDGPMTPEPGEFLVAGYCQ
jgi:beta-glucosidase